LCHTGSLQKKDHWYNACVYCECGCGEEAPIATRNDPRGRYRKGEHARYVNGHQSRKNPIENPQYRIDGNGCWVWLWSREPKGYGILRNGDQMDRAHRVYWERTHGPIPAGMELHHTCENKPCVNPGHLELLTSGEHAEESWTQQRRAEQAQRMKAIQPLGARAKQRSAT
jgi:hypothetical protein